MGYVSELRALVGTRPLLLVGAGVLLWDGLGRLLLQRRTDDNLWGIIGGGVELGESVEDAARREAFEETGLTVGHLKLFGVFSGPKFWHTYPNGDKASIISIVYQTCASGELVCGDESRELRYFSLDELAALSFSGPNRAIVEQLLANKT